MPKILLPINIDKWRSPIATLLRACVEFNPHIDFVSFSMPETDEDHANGERFWRLNNIKKGNFRSLLGRYDIVHIASHTPRNLLAGTIAKIVGSGDTSFLYTINLELESENRNTPIYKWFNATVDYYVSVSYIAGKLVREDLPKSYFGVIPNGYDSSYFNPDLDFSQDLPDAVAKLDGKPFVLNVAALEPRKHPEWILQMAKSYPDIYFVMAGWVVPNCGEKYLRMIQDAKLPNVIWLGHVTRSVIRALLGSASAFAFPSDREGLPLSVIEAMGMGVPVIAQNKSSLPELITSEMCGSLISIDQPNSIHEWGNAVHEYISMDCSLREKHKNILAQYTQSKYSWENVGRMYSTIYSAILDLNQR
jgi:glycosyltransferase involved in cell wall biosynthesis